MMRPFSLGRVLSIGARLDLIFDIGYLRSGTFFGPDIDFVPRVWAKVSEVPGERR